MDLEDSRSNLELQDSPLTFTPLTIDDRDLYEHYYRRDNSLISDLCFNSRIAWLEGFDYHKSIVEETLVLTAQSNFFTGLHFSMPLGLQSAEHFRRIVEAIWSPYAELNAAILLTSPNPDDSYFFRTGLEEPAPFLRFLYFSEENLDYVRALEDDFEVKVILKEAYSDYLYERTKLETLSGKSLRSRRNHWNRFIKTYPDYRFKRFGLEDIDAALDLTRNWCIQKAVDPEDLRVSDYLPIRAYLSHFEALDGLGGALYLGDRLIAFSLASSSSHGMNVSHFEKADESVEGAYAAINRLMAAEIYVHDFVNREEDMGDAGIRQAKEAYRPIRKIPKYEIVLRKKMCEV